MTGVAHLPKKLYLEDFYFTYKFSQRYDPPANGATTTPDNGGSYLVKPRDVTEKPQFPVGTNVPFVKIEEPHREPSREPSPEPIGETTPEPPINANAKTNTNTVLVWHQQKGTRGGQLHERKYHCTYCNFRTKYTKSLREHLLLHKSRDEIEIFKCDECQYETRRKSYLKKHSLIHKTDTQVEMHKCPHCDFVTKRKDGLQRHVLLIHTDAAETKIYKCSQCSYQTKLSYSLTSHMLVHQDDEVLYKYTCDQCPYKSKERKPLLKHLLTHKTKQEQECFRCPECRFECVRKSGLNHHLRPAPTDGQQTYTCTVCWFKTDKKKCYRGHLASHRDRDNVYQCPHCPYQHLLKKKLCRHMSVHRDADEVYKKCGECPFKTKWADALVTHRLRHVKIERHDDDGELDNNVDLLGGTLYRCVVCSYNARSKAQLTRHLKMHKFNQ